MSCLAVIDFETTGATPAQGARATEVAICLLEGGRIVDRYASLMNAGVRIPSFIIQLTGITNEMVAAAPPANAVMREAAAFVGSRPMVAHNAAFDRPFVEARLPVFAQQAWNCSFAGINWKTEGNGSAKLEFLASERGWFYDAHRALTDCHALLQVLAQPLSDGRTGLRTLVEGAQGTRYKLLATGSPFETKDKLKARGYRWDGENRAWWCSLPSQEALDTECQWLRAEVYGGRKARVMLEALDSQTQFSGRPGQVSQLVLE